MQKQTKKLLVTLLAGLLLCGVVACEKKEEAKHAEHAAAPSEHAGHEMPGGEHAAVPEDHGAPSDKPAAPKSVVVSDEIRAAWSTVTLAVKDKESNTVKNYDAKPESELVIEGSTLVIKLGAYLPDFSMTPDQIVSRSAEPNNPAIQVTILDSGVEKYKGWLFAKFPDMHAFEHPKYGVTLFDKNAQAATEVPGH